MKLIQGLNSRSGIGSYALSNNGDWIVLVSSRDVPGEQRGNDGPQADVHVETGLTYQTWVEELRAGRSFACNGPLIELHIGESGAGDTIQSDHSGSFRVRAKAWAQYPLEPLEIVYNGNVIGTGTIADDKLSHDIKVWTARHPSYVICG